MAPVAGWLENLLRSFSGQFWEGGSNLPSDETVLAEAHRDWLAAREFFDHATDPDLIDYAILSLQAAEKRYVYLWKKARQKSGREEV